MRSLLPARSSHSSSTSRCSLGNNSHGSLSSGCRTAACAWQQSTTSGASSVIAPQVAALPALPVAASSRSSSGVAARSLAAAAGAALALPLEADRGMMTRMHTNMGLVRNELMTMKMMRMIQSWR